MFVLRVAAKTFGTKKSISKKILEEQHLGMLGRITDFGR